MKAQKWTPGWNRCMIVGQIRAGQWSGVDFRLRNQHPLPWWFCDDNMWQIAPELVSSAGHPLHYQGNLLIAWTSVYTHLKNWRKYLPCEEWRPKHCSGCKGSDEHEIFQCPKLSLLMFRIWRRQWHPTPVLLPGKIPWTEEPGRLQSIGSLRVGHDWATSLSLFTFTHWRRKWQPTPVFLPEESQGRGSLVGCRLWGCTGSDTTEVT